MEVRYGSTESTGRSRDNVAISLQRERGMYFVSPALSVFDAFIMINDAWWLGPCLNAQ